MVEFIEIEYLRENEVKIALGSSAPSKNVDHVLVNFGLRKYFGSRGLTGNEVYKGKPFPDIFYVPRKGRASLLLNA